MKATELRLGNLVLYNNEQTHIINGYDIADLDIDPIEDSFTPIPLTEEWLLKFGFKKFITTDIYPTYVKRSLQVNDGVVYLSGYGFLSNIKQVHQLQNLYFALTGEELKINQ